MVRALGLSAGDVRRSRCAHGDNPLDLHCIPLVTPGCGNPTLVESTGDISCGRDALPAQSLNGCHGRFVTHQPCHSLWFVVGHRAFPAGLGASRERASRYFNPGHDFYTGRRDIAPPRLRVDGRSNAIHAEREMRRSWRRGDENVAPEGIAIDNGCRDKGSLSGHEPTTGNSITLQLRSAPRQATPPARLATPSRLSLRVNSRHSAPKPVIKRPPSSMRPRSPALPA